MVILVFTVLTLVVGYVLLCAGSPFADCDRCGGRGYPTTKRGIRSGYKCGRCNGTGKRLRIGRRLMNAAIKGTQR
jgi:hypothetical protein